MEHIHCNGDIMVEWEYNDEGWSGDYDPDDPDDTQLLRFDVCRLESEGWVSIDDASYCTLFPLDTPSYLKLRALHLIMDNIYFDATTGNSIKKACEHLSWIEPSWVDNLYPEIK